MNTFQWIVLGLMAVFAFGMMWFARTYTPEVSVSPRAYVASPAPQAQTQTQVSSGSGPTVVVVGSQKAIIVPQTKYSFTPAQDLELSNISEYRMKGSQRVLVFKDGSETYLTDQDYAQLPKGIRLRFEYTQGKP